MRSREIHIPGAILEEGKSYRFTIMKTIALSPGDEWYLMKGPGQYKILMPKKYYVRYGFVSGQTVRCRIDKINCTGRIFLEPEHPFYREGALYPFEVISRGVYVSRDRKTEQVFIVKDVLGNLWKVKGGRDNKWDQTPEKLVCLVKRIKKGKLFLLVNSCDCEADNPLSHKTGKSYLSVNC